MSRCGTHGDLFPVLSFQPLCSSVQTQAVAVVQARVCPTAMERAAGPGALAQRLGRVLNPILCKNAENGVFPPVRKRILILFGLENRLRLHFQRFCVPLAAVYCGQCTKVAPNALREKAHHLPKEGGICTVRTPHVSTNLWSESERARRPPKGDYLAHRVRDCQSRRD